MTTYKKTIQSKSLNKEKCDYSVNTAEMVVVAKLVLLHIVWHIIANPVNKSNTKSQTSTSTLSMEKGYQSHIQLTPDFP